MEEKKGTVKLEGGGFAAKNALHPDCRMLGSTISVPRCLGDNHMPVLEYSKSLASALQMGIGWAAGLGTI